MFSKFKIRLIIIYYDSHSNMNCDICITQQNGIYNISKYGPPTMISNRSLTKLILWLSRRLDLKYYSKHSIFIFPVSSKLILSIGKWPFTNSNMNVRQIKLRLSSMYVCFWVAALSGTMHDVHACYLLILFFFPQCESNQSMSLSVNANSFLYRPFSNSVG